MFPVIGEPCDCANISQPLSAHLVRELPDALHQVLIAVPVPGYDLTQGRNQLEGVCVIQHVQTRHSHLENRDEILISLTRTSYKNDPDQRPMCGGRCVLRADMTPKLCL